MSEPLSAATVKLVALRLPSVRSMIAPELRVIAPTSAEAGMDVSVYELVAFRVAALATVTALEAIEPVEPMFKMPFETVVAPV